MAVKSNVSGVSTDAHNTSTESKKSLSRLGSSFIHRIQSSTHFIGPKSFNVSVQLLDDSETVQGSFKKTATGQDVLDFVCKHLNIVEKEYFGLRYIDKYRYWLDLSAPLSKTFITNNVALAFRFRFYPNDLESIKEEVTRYQLFVQLQRDLLHGRLQCKQFESSQLAALILQAEQGDYDEEKHLPGYVSEFKLLLRQSEKVEEKIAQIHQSLRGMTVEEATDEFLRQCFTLQTFGINPYTVSIGKTSTDVVIGASSDRVLVFVSNQVVYDIPWSYVSDIDYSGKLLKLRFKKEYFSDYLAVNPNLSPDVALSKVVGSTLFHDDLKPDKKLQLKFTCPSSTFAKNLWRDLNSQQVFFNEDKAENIKPRFSKPKIPLFTRGSTFRCPVRRTMREIQHDATPAREIEQHEFVRYSLPRQKPRSDESFHSHKEVPEVTYESLPSPQPPQVLVPSITIETSSLHVNDDVSPIEESKPFEQNESKTDEVLNQCESVVASPENYNQIHVEYESPRQKEVVPELQLNGNLIQNGSNDKLSNGAVLNGKPKNGSVFSSSKPLAKKDQTLGRKIIVGFLDLVVLILLASILIIAVFECLGPNEPQWFRPHISNFRANYYNQWRSALIHRYNHLFY